LATLNFQQARIPVCWKLIVLGAKYIAGGVDVKKRLGIG